MKHMDFTLFPPYPLGACCSAEAGVRASQSPSLEKTLASVCTPRLLKKKTSIFLAVMFAEGIANGFCFFIHSS